MAVENPILGINGAAAADYETTPYQYYGAYLSAAETLTKNATLGGFCHGVLQTSPQQYEHCSVGAYGLYKVKLGGTVAIGDPLCINASGLFIKNTCDNYFTVARAINAGVSDDVICADFRERGYNNTQADMTLDACVSNKRIAKAVFDPTTNSGERTAADHGLGVYLPDNAVITRAYYRVETTFTSTAGGTDKATLAITIPTDDVAGILAAVAIEDGGNPWDAGWHEAIQTGTAANFSERTTAIRELTITIGVCAVTGGKLYLYCEYIVVA